MALPAEQGSGEERDPCGSEWVGGVDRRSWGAWEEHLWIDFGKLLFFFLSPSLPSPLSSSFSSFLYQNKFNKCNVFREKYTKHTGQAERIVARSTY